MRLVHERGMTLLELLVALVIGALVIALVIRGLGLSLKLYERVSAVTQNMDTAFRERQWWVDSVGSLMPCTLVSHCVTGSSNTFSGYTLAPILHPAGMRYPIRWKIVEKDGRSRLQLSEGDGKNPEAMVMSWHLPPQAHFVYLGPDGQWRDRWEPASVHNRLPVAIQIESSDGAVWATASTLQRPYARPDYRDMLGGP